MSAPLPDVPPVAPPALYTLLQAMRKELLALREQLDALLAKEASEP
jgi:hypothetical protein